MVTSVFSIPLRPLAPSPGNASPRSRAGVQRGATDFIAGGENWLALAAVEALWCAATDYNPLVLCGDAGSGKSHLARGVAARWLEASAGLPTSDVRPPTSSDDRVVVTDALLFGRELARARRFQRLAAWRGRLYRAELLVVEDVHLLAGHSAAQRELATTIDARLAIGGQLVVTSRGIPAAMDGLLPQLRGRLAEGLVVTLAPPQRPARLALLQARARQREILLDDAAAEALSAGLPLAAGELVAALDELAAAAGSSLSTAVITADAARAFIAQRRQGRSVRIGVIARRVARRYRLQVADLKGPSRRRGVATARSLTMYLCRRLSGLNLQQIGDYLGGRDHSTILHGCQKTQRLLAHDPATRAEVAQLTMELENPRIA